MLQYIRDKMQQHPKAVWIIAVVVLLVVLLTVALGTYVYYANTPEVTHAP